MEPEKKLHRENSILLCTAPRSPMVPQGALYYHAATVCLGAFQPCLPPYRHICELKPLWILFLTQPRVAPGFRLAECSVCLCQVLAGTDLHPKTR